ncbi:MAG: peptidylprolyl isomerase [Rikenellaceae bacterium]
MKTKKYLVLLAIGFMPLFGFAQEVSMVVDSVAVDTVAVTKAQDTIMRMEIADRVIAMVGNNVIMYSDLENAARNVADQRRQQGSLSDQTEKEEALESLLVQKLMATCANLDSLDKDLPAIDNMVELRVAEMAASVGGVLELERKMGKPIFQIKSDVTLEARQMQLSSTMQQYIESGVTINIGEVREYLDTLDAQYLEMVPEQYSFSQIVKIPPQTEERKYAIREQLLEYRRRILDGEVTLGALAQLYSADLQSARKRGEMGPMATGLLVQPFIDAVQEMKPGEVSEIVETEYGYHIIELISLTGTAPNQMVHLRHILLKPEFTVEESRNVVAQLDSLTTEINAGNITFAEAALKYSDDKDTKENGGKAFNTYGYYSSGNVKLASSRYRASELQYQPYDYRELAELKVGEISEPYETMDGKGNIVHKIIRLDAITDAHVANIDEDYELIANDAKLAKTLQVFEDWVDNNISRVYVHIDSTLWDYNLQKEGWILAARRTAQEENLPVKMPTRDDIEDAITKRQERIAREVAEAKLAAELAAIEAAKATPVEDKKGKKKKK